MATLHYITEGTRSILKWGIILIALFFIFLFFFRAVGGDIKEYFFPTAPTVKFGKLPKIVFPQSQINKKITYSLNTLSGKLPNFPKSVKVYKTIPFTPSLLSLKNAQERVAKINFREPPVPLSDTSYQWNLSNGDKIIMDVVSSNFSYSSSSLFNLSTDTLPDKNLAITKATSFLENISSLPGDIDSAKTKTTPLSIENSTFVLASSLSTARIIRVDFFQKNVNDLPILYPNPFQSTMSVLIGSDGYEGIVVQANFSHQDISEIYATYPIKTAEEALSQLKEGKVYIAGYYGEGKVLINNIFLGYYMGNDLQTYLMPIIVFQGDNGFVAYISAVKEAWISD